MYILKLSDIISFTVLSMEPLIKEKPAEHESLSFALPIPFEQEFLGEESGTDSKSRVCQVRRPLVVLLGQKYVRFVLVRFVLRSPTVAEFKIL